MTRFTALLPAIFLCVLIASPCMAGDVPVPTNKKAAIGDLDRKFAKEKEEASALEQQQAEIKAELKSGRDDLIDLAANIQANEKILQNLDKKTQALSKEKEELEDTLRGDKGSIAKLILALERLRRTPPEAMIVKPDVPLKTAQSAMLMRDIIPALNQKAEKLKNDLERLKDLSSEIDAKRQAILTKTETLRSDHARISTLVEKRTALYASTQSDLAEKTRRMNEISAQAKNLQELVARLDNERTQSAARVYKGPRRIDNTLPSPGQPRLPISGLIKVGYNEPDNFGAPNNGLDIEGVAGALVVAPMGGTIRFAGHFKNYGNMVILEHEGGWHSLIAGLEKIDTVVGQNIDAGEPLGVLHESSSGDKPVLYYELRHHGKTVNPSKKFAELS